MENPCSNCDSTSMEMCLLIRHCEHFVTKKSKEESRCKEYVGVTCEECGYYKGCEDCALAGTEHCNKAPTGGGKDGTER